jgi:hypothetical protein
MSTPCSSQSRISSSYEEWPIICFHSFESLSPSQSGSLMNLTPTNFRSSPYCLPFPHFSVHFDFCYRVHGLWFHCLSNLSILSVPDEGYSRIASCALNLTSTVSIQRIAPPIFIFMSIQKLVHPHPNPIHLNASGNMCAILSMTT